MSAEDSLSRIQLLLRDKQQRSSFQDTQFAQGDANGDGLLQRDELRSAVATVCSTEQWQCLGRASVGRPRRA